MTSFKRLDAAVLVGGLFVRAPARRGEKHELVNDLGVAVAVVDEAPSAASGPMKLELRHVGGLRQAAPLILRSLVFDPLRSDGRPVFVPDGLVLDPDAVNPSSAARASHRPGDGGAEGRRIPVSTVSDHWFLLESGDVVVVLDGLLPAGCDPASALEQPVTGGALERASSTAPGEIAVEIPIVGPTLRGVRMATARPMSAGDRRQATTISRSLGTPSDEAHALRYQEAFLERIETSVLQELAGGEPHPASGLMLWSWRGRLFLSHAGDATAQRDAYIAALRSVLVRAHHESAGGEATTGTHRSWHQVPLAECGPVESGSKS